MPFVKGKSGNAKGKVKGTPNRVTGTMKEILTAIVLEEYQSGRVASAMQKLYDQNAGQYVACLDKLGESILPKLSRSELTGKDGQDLKLTWVINDNNIHSTEAPS